MPDVRFKMDFLCHFGHNMYTFVIIFHLTQKCNKNNFDVNHVNHDPT